MCYIKTSSAMVCPGAPTSGTREGLKMRPRGVTKPSSQSTRPAKGWPLCQEVPLTRGTQGHMGNATLDPPVALASRDCGGPERLPINGPALVQHETGQVNPPLIHQLQQYQGLVVVLKGPEARLIISPMTLGV